MSKPIFCKRKKQSDDINKLISKDLTIDYNALKDFLNYGFIIGEKTPFKEIKRKHRMILNKKEKITNIKLIKQEFLKNLKKSISKAIGKEKRIGLFLSGGIDSTSLAIVLGNYFKKIKVNVYTASFKSNKSEIEFAKEISKKYGFRHKIVGVGMKDFELWPKIIKAIGMPITDEASIPLYKMAEQAKKDKIKVIFVGDANDELWCGYDWYYKLRNIKRKIPYLFFLGKILQKFKSRKLRTLGEMMMAKNWKEFIRKRYLFDLKIRTPYCWLEQRYGIIRSLNMKLKFPYLSQELIGLAYNVPLELKLKKENKWIVKEAIADIDKIILERKKRLMGFPKKEMFKINKNKVKKIINNSKFVKYNCFDTYEITHRKFILALYLKYLSSLNIKT